MNDMENIKSYWNEISKLTMQRDEAIKILILVLDAWRVGESINESTLYEIAQKHIEGYTDSLDIKQKVTK